MTKLAMTKLAKPPEHLLFESWAAVHEKLRCFNCGEQYLNVEESTGQNGGPANAPGDGEHRSKCGSCGLYTYFDVEEPT